MKIYNISIVMLNRHLLAFVIFAFGGMNPASAQEPKEVSLPATKPDAAINSRIVSRALSILPGNQPVISELDIQAYQLEQIKEIQHGFSKRMGHTAQSITNAPVERRKQQFQSLYEELEAELAEVLLPSQAKRLKEIAIQSFAVSPVDGSLNLPNLIAMPAIQQQLELTAQEIADLRTQTKQASERLAQEIEQLKARSREALLGRLSIEQKCRLHGLIGEPFDFEGYAPGRGGRFRKTTGDH